MTPPARRSIGRRPSAGEERRRAGRGRHPPRPGRGLRAIRLRRRSRHSCCSPIVSDPIAPQMVGGLLQKVTMTAAPDLMMQGGMRQFETYAGPLTPQQRSAVDTWLPQLKPGGAPDAGRRRRGDGRDRAGRRRDATDNQRGSLVSFYAAGIGVMFLLFSWSARPAARCSRKPSPARSSACCRPASA